MDKKLTMIIAVAVVAVIVGAGCVVVFGNHGSPEKKPDVPIASGLQILGNANDDYTIDDKDMAIMDDILAGKKDFKDYPLADVNHDGTVNETDKILLQNLIDRKEGSKVNVLCLDFDGNPSVVEVTYPLRNIVPYGTNVQMPCLYANGGQYFAGYFVSSYDNAERSIASGARDLGGTQRQISPAAWSNFSKLAGDSMEKGGLGAVVIDYSGISQFTPERIGDLRAAGIPALIFSSADAESEVTTVLTMGFLFGGDSETVAAKYAQTSWNIFEEVKKKVGGLSDSEKTSYISFTMHIYICQNDSTFNQSGIVAGGIPYYKVNSEFAKSYKGTGSVKMASVEALSNYKNDVGAFVNNRSIDWGLDDYGYKKIIIETWNHDNSGTPTVNFFKGAEDKLNFINNLLPAGVRVAYMAHALYGSEFSLKWADDQLLSFIGMGTEPLKGQTLGSVVGFFDKTVYEKAKGIVAASSNAVDILSTAKDNLSGNLSAGADGATFGFANGSNAESATIKVPNGSTSTRNPDNNTITVKVTSDAKSLFEINEEAYKEKEGTSAMDYDYHMVKVNTKFDGIIGYYMNKTDSGSASGYLSGYVGKVFFESYFYVKGTVNDADFQKVADAVYKGIFDTIEYTGPAIPEDIPAGTLTGAGLVAEAFVNAAGSAWTVSSESTETTGVVNYACPGKTEKTAIVNIYVGSDAADKYATKSAEIAALDGTKAMGSINYSIMKTPVSVAGVKCTAVFAKVGSNAFLQFTMQHDDTFVEISIAHDSKAYLYLAGENASDDAKGIMNTFATVIVK